MPFTPAINYYSMLRLKSLWCLELYSRPWMFMAIFELCMRALAAKLRHRAAYEYFFEFSSIGRSSALGSFSSADANAIGRSCVIEDDDMPPLLPDAFIRRYFLRSDAFFWLFWFDFIYFLLTLLSRFFKIRNLMAKDAVDEVFSFGGLLLFSISTQVSAPGSLLATNASSFLYYLFFAFDEFSISRNFLFMTFQ